MAVRLPVSLTTSPEILVFITGYGCPLKAAIDERVANLIFTTSGVQYSVAS